MSVTNWKKVKAKIEQTLDQIYLEMPLDVKKFKEGILPYNAGHNRQYLSALESLMMTLMGWCFYSTPTITQILNDKSFTLEQCKKLVVLNNRNPARYTGYIAYPMVWNLWLEVETSLASIETKEELKELMVSWLFFINRMHFWNVQIFPWYLAKYMETKNVAEIDGKKYFTGRVTIDSTPMKLE